MHKIFLFALFCLGVYGCPSCPVNTFTTPSTFDTSMPTSIVIESDYQVNLIVNYKSDIDQISIVMRENVNSVDECTSLAKPSLNFNAVAGSITLNVFKAEPAHEPSILVAPASHVSSATKLSALCLNMVGLVAFSSLFQKHYRFALLFLAITLLPYSLSECQSGRSLTMEINIPEGMNLKFIRVHSEGQYLCVDPSGNQCGEVSQNTTWTDAKGNYSVTVENAPCNITNGNFSVRFEATEALEYVTLMYQFASKCDASHCDCSTPVAMTATDASNKTYTALIRGSGKPESALYVYALYKGPTWGSRNQYPVDALPHQFIKTNIGCEGAVEGACDPNNCWVALGQRGCSP